MLGLFLIKLYNLSKGSQVYGVGVIIISLVVAFLFWGFMIVTFMGSIQLEDTATITDELGKVTTVVQSDNTYSLFSILQNVGNILLSINIMFSIVEILMLAGTLPIRPKMARVAIKK